MLLNLPVFSLKIFILLFLAFYLFVIHRVRDISPVCEKKAIPGAIVKLSGRSPAGTHKVILGLNPSNANKTRQICALLGPLKVL